MIMEIRVLGGCDAKSDRLGDGDLFVVMGPTTTQERREVSHRDIRGQGRAPRQAHLAQESQWLGPAGREAPDGHRSGGGGAWQNKSETPPGAVIMGSVLLGQQLSHDHDGDRQGGRHDHGSGAPGTAGTR